MAPSLQEIDARLNEAISQAYKAPGRWMSLATGGFWFFNEPNRLDVNVVDVAYGLARQTRYNGQYRTDIDFFSVSEHSRLMLEGILDETEDADETLLLEDRLMVLLHDMPEDVLGDMLSMLKSRFHGYREFEDQHFSVRFAGFISDPSGVEITKKRIKEFDVRIRMNERDAIIVEPSATVGREQERLPWLEGLPKRLNVKIEGNAPRKEARIFLDTFVTILENTPARLEENAPENNPQLMRHYMIACDHIGREPAPHMAEAADRMLEEAAATVEP